MTKADLIKENRIRVKKEFFIDPEGKIHKYKGDLSIEIVSIHSEIASVFYPESNRPTDVLLNIGWCMVGSTVYAVPIMNKKPTQQQINKLYELGLYKRLCVLFNNSYPNYDENQHLF